MSDELKDFEVKIRQLVDKQFKPAMEASSFALEWISEGLEMDNKIQRLFDDQPNEVVRNNALSLLSSMFISQTKRQLAIAQLQHQIIKELKDTSFHSYYLPFQVYQEMTVQIWPIIADRLKNLEKGLDALKKEGVEVGLNVGEEMRKDIKIIVKKIEEAKKAMNKYVI